MISSGSEYIMYSRGRRELRIVIRRRLREFWEAQPAAEEPLKRWYLLTQNATWRSTAEVTQTFGSADQVKVNSGSTVTVFNVGGNKFRLVAAIHYDYPRVFVLRVMTHVEYDKDKWKEEL